MVPIMGSITLSSFRRVAPVLCAAAGLALAFFGAVQIAAEPNRAALGLIVSDIHAGKPADSVFLRSARDELRASRDGNLVAMAGVVAAQEAQRNGLRSQQGRIWLQLASADLRRGLAMAPADGFAWLRLAGVEYLLNGPSELAVKAIVNASYMVKTDSNSIPLMLSLSASLWPRLPETVKTQVQASMQALWKHPRRRDKLDVLLTSSNGRVLLIEILGQQPGLEAWIGERNEEFRIQREKAMTGR
jgi:hypothetical protein